MAKRVFLLVVVALALPATALSATVKVRVEGKTQTLFAPTQVTVTAANALDALEQASILGEFYYHVTVSGFGTYVDQIGRYPGSGSSGWAFKVDNVSPPVGADQVVLKDGDSVLWYYATFGPNGGPPTLQLSPAARRLLHGASLRRQRKAGNGRKPRSAHRFEPHDARPFEPEGVPRHAQGPARPRHRG